MTDHRARADLTNLLVEMFSGPELLRFVRFLPDGDRLANALPLSSSLAQLGFETTQLLERHGRIDAGLFDALEAERPRRRDEILELRRRLLPGEADPAPRPTRPDGGGAGPWDLFLAHASPDKPRVREVYEALRRAGADREPSALRVFFDEASVSPGTVWAHEISQALDASKIIVVFISTSMSRAWFASEEILRSIERMRANEARIVPVYLDGFIRGGVPYGLTQLHGINAEQLDAEALADRILAVVDAR